MSAEVRIKVTSRRDPMGFFRWEAIATTESFGSLDRAETTGLFRRTTEFWAVRRLLKKTRARIAPEKREREVTR